MKKRDSGLLNCAEVRSRIYPLLLRTLSARERAETVEHATGCESCRLALDAGRRRLEGVVGGVGGDLQDLRRPRRKLRFWLALLPAVPAAIAFLLLLQQGIRVARYRYEQRFIGRLEKALVLYRQDFGEFPPPNGAPLSVYLGTSEGHGPYLDLAKERRDGVGHFIDHWGNRYVYSCPGERGRNPRLFDLHSYGQNRRDDGGRGDDITNWEEGWERIPPAEP